MSNIKILFSGYYGHKNMGDDAFGLVSVWGAKKYWNVKNTALLSPKGPTNEQVSIKYVLPKEQKFKGEYLIKSFWEILRSDFVILSGGSILNKKTKNTSLNGIIFLLAKLNLTKIAAIGVSIGPFLSKGDYKFIQNQLKGFEFLVLRDEKSFNIATSMDLPYLPVLGSDLAFLLPEIYKQNRPVININIKTVGISLCHYERYVNGNIENEVRREKLFFEVVKELINESNIKIRFFIINGHDRIGDLEITTNLIKQLKIPANKYELIPYSPNTLLMLEKLSECQVVFSTRLHGAIFSASMNVPSILVEYHSKCTDYLDDLGVSEEFRIGDLNVPPLIIKNKLIKILNSEISNFYPNKKKINSLSIKNFTSIKLNDKIHSSNSII